jgi:alpha-tubulin suppressor-like RCC1 family protein
MRQSLTLLYAALFTCTAQALTLLTTTLPTAIQGVPYRALLSVSGNPQPFAYGAEIVGLPDGLTATYNYFGGFEIAGTPTRWGEFPLRVTATNGIYSIDTPVRLSVNRYSNRVSAIAQGYFHACALSDGSVYCWGLNHYGAVPGGSTMEWTPRLVMRPERGATAIASGGAFSCAVAGGGVYCWGGWPGWATWDR